MRSKPLGGILLGLLVVLTTHAADAGLGTWKNYTSMKNVTGLARQGTTFWASTLGGLFQWNPEEGTFRQYTSAEGLQGIDLTSIGIDGKGSVWTGSSSGYVSVLHDPASAIRIIPDIANLKNQTNKQINSFWMEGDSILISTAFGLSVFRIDKFEFGDTYTRFGTIPPNVRVGVNASAVFDNKIWACISDGGTTNRIAVASLSSSNLLPPEAWTLQTVGSPGTVPTSLAIMSGHLYAGTSTGLYLWDGSVWVAISSVGTQAVRCIAAGTGHLAVCTSTDNVFLVDSQGNASPYGTSLTDHAFAVALDNDNHPTIGTAGSGLMQFLGQWTQHYPNGPNANQFSSVRATPEGVVWAGSGPANGGGMYRFDGTTWVSYTRANSALPSNEVYQISIGCDGSVWGSTWGRGVVWFPPGQTSIDTANLFGLNVGMVGIGNDLSFVVVSNVACDSRGNSWMTILDAADKRPLAVRKADGTWLTMPVTLAGTRLITLTGGSVDRSVAIDGYDNLWILVRDAAFRGVINMGNGGAVDSVANVQVSSTNGLPSDDVTTIVVDRSNDIWVGTSKGIAIILDPLNPNGLGGIATYKPLNGQYVNTIAVDPLNQKWVGTTEGVILLSPDGTQVLASYTREGTEGKLIANDVKSITVDPQTGTVYFGTVQGLSSLTTSAAAPVASFNGLNVYPNPYIIPATTLLSVDGLVEDSRLKILTADGSLVRDIDTPGGRIGFWDGKDAKGNDVASGVYIIVAYSKDGAQLANGKVAVIRR
jgi:ligand-binding sensor domain-containing protein